MIQKSDYLIALVCGALTALLTFPILVMIGKGISYWWMLVFLLFPFVWVMGIFFGQWLERNIAEFFGKFSKYVAVGFLSAAIDFVFLNVLSLITGVTAGIVVGWINVPGFIFATFNAYVWNKRWVFRSPNSFSADFPKFFAVTILGLFLNSAIIIGFTTYIAKPLNFSDVAWLNFSKILAGAAVIVWNFTGYRKFAFNG